MTDPLDKSALRNFKKWELPTGMISDEKVTSVPYFLDHIEETVELLRENIEVFLTKNKKYKEPHRELLSTKTEELISLCGLARTAFQKLSAGDVRYAESVAKLFARIGQAVEVISFLAGPLSTRDQTDEHDTTFFELAWIGSDTDKQRTESLSRAVSARVNVDWRDKAQKIWEEHPTWTHNRVASAIANEFSADQRSVMRAIEPLIPPTSPSHPSQKS